MKKVYLFSQSSYTPELIKMHNELSKLPDDVLYHLKFDEFINDYISDALWYEDKPYGAFHRKVINALEQVEIVCFHNTRLADKKDVEENGLIFSDNRYLESIKNNIANSGISKDLQSELVMKIDTEISRWNDSDGNRRRDQICFFFAMDSYKGYDKFLAIYGGEFMESICLSNWAKENMYQLKNVFKLGKPYVIEFALPFNKLCEFKKQDVARYLIEEWVHIDLRHDEPDHAYDSWCNFEIPPEDIIALHEVEDCFELLDEWYLGK